jgi:hypothetical protein
LGEILRSPGEPLNASTRAAMEPRFGHDFSRVRVHADNRAAASAEQANASAYTVGRDIVFAGGQYKPQTATGRDLLAHELTHVVQQKDAAARAGNEQLITEPIHHLEQEADRVAARATSAPIASLHRAPALAVQKQPATQPTTQPTTQPATQPASQPASQPAAAPAVTEIKGLPKTERQAIKVSPFSPFNDAWKKNIELYYTDPKGSGGDKFPTSEGNVKVNFGSTIKKETEAGLNSVAAYLYKETHKSEKADPDDHQPLGMNTTISLAIEAASGIFRFTRVNHAADGKQQETVLIEYLAPLAVKTLAKAKVKDNKLTVRSSTFKLGAGWKADDLDILSDALAMLPDSLLSQVAVYTLNREAQLACTDDQIKAGTCNLNTSGATRSFASTITFYDDTFRETATRIGAAERVRRAILHEAGHGVDEGPLATAYAGYKTKKKTAKTETEVKKLLEKAEKPRSVTGQHISHVEKESERNFSLVTEAKEPAGDYKEAAKKDGVVENPDGSLKSGGITRYAEGSWQENFAEAFAFYFTDPDLLKLLRPNTFEYFQKTYAEKKKEEKKAKGAK